MITVRLSTAVLALSLLAACRGWESESPPVHLIPNMDTQEKGKAYRRDTSGLMPDGRVMQAPLEGTVAQGEFIDDDLYNEGKDPGGEPTANLPAAIKPEGAQPGDGQVLDGIVAHGRIRSNIYCAPCHGRDGDGNGPVSRRGLVVPAPAFTSDRVKQITNGQIYSAIKNGVNGENMPPYAHQIPTYDRWAIVAAIRDIQGLPLEGAKGVVVAAATTASAEHGQQLYAARGCNACHSIDGTRVVGPTFKGLYGKTEETSAGTVTVDDAYLNESMVNPNAKIVNGFPPAMPPFAGPEIERQSLILFIQSLK